MNSSKPRSIITNLYFFVLFLGSISISQAQITVLTENFDSSSSLPSGWTEEAVTGSETWGLRNGGYNPGIPENYNHPTSAYSGSNNAYYHRNNTGTTKRNLVTPELDLTGLGNVTLTFYDARLQWGTATDYLIIYYRTSSTASWTQLQNFTSPTTSWVKRTVTLPNPNGTYYVAFQAVGNYGYGVCLDDITITAELANDAGVTDFFVSGTNIMNAVIKNYGADDLTSVKFKWQIDANNPDSFSWTGKISSEDTDTIAVKTQYFSHGTHDIKIWTEKPSGKDDGDNSNDTFNTTYTIIRDFPYSESFESGDGHFSQSLDDDLDWTRYKNYTPTSGTGPTSAQDGTYYYYIEATGNLNKSAIIYSTDFDLSSLTNPYIEFWYHMYAHPQAGKMGSLDLETDSSNQWVSIFNRSGNQGNNWIKGLIPLEDYRNMTKFRFYGTTASYYSDMAFDNIKVFDYPEIHLEDSITICEGDIVTLQVDTGVDYSFAWLNINTGDTLSKSSSYTTDTTIDIELWVYSSFGYYAVDSIHVSQHPMPYASFGLKDTHVCFKDHRFDFNNKSNISSGKLYYTWDFGDDSISNDTNPSYSYQTADTFKVWLKAESEYGCADSMSMGIIVDPSPVADISVLSEEACFYENHVNLNSNSSIQKDVITTYYWDFGDTSSASTKNVKHTYQYVNTYNIMHVVTGSLGCSDTVYKSWIVKEQPLVSFDINDSSQCFLSNNFSFTNKTKDKSASVDYIWKFGTIDTSHRVNPDYTFAKTGTFDITLIAINNESCTDTVSKKVYVHPDPTAQFSINDPTQCLNQDYFVLTNNSTISSGNMTYTWDLGDGTQSTKSSETHSYNKTGQFEIKLMATSDNMCQDSISQTIYVYDVPVAGITLTDSIQCFKNNAFFFDGSSSLGQGNITKRLWILGDNSTSNLEDHTYSYNTTGEFTVKYILESDQGCADTATGAVIVNPEPIAVFTIDDSSQCLSSNAFVLTNNSSISKGNMEYAWDFGNMQTSSAKDTTMVYQNPGTFTIKLNVSSDGACKDSIEKTVIVEPSPTVDFDMSDSNSCLIGNQFIFNNLSDPTQNLDYTWDFGDMTTSKLSSPTHAYLTDGKYQVKLTGISGNNCSDSVIRNIEIYPEPTINFTVNDTAQCLNGNLFDFSNLSTISSGNIFYKWEIDNQEFNTTDLNYSFSGDGNYKVKLTGTSDHNCIDSMKQSLYVYPSPLVDLGNDTTLKSWHSLILDAGSGQTSYLWSDNSNQQTLEVKGSNLGFGDNEFSVEVTNSYGCQAQDTIIIKLDSVNGIEESLSQTILKLYPNPSKGIIYVEFNEKPTANVVVKVYDLHGHTVFSDELMPMDQRIALDLSHISKGTYFVNLILNENSLSYKLILF